MRLKVFLCLGLLSACSAPEAVNSTPELATETAATVIQAPPQLVQAWSTSGFSAPEGVATYKDTLFISNVVGEPSGKDALGWISRVAMDGTMIEERWVEGMNAPKGMDVRGNILFVTDIDAYHTINADTGEIINTFDVPEAGFLNDVTLWNQGIFASDSTSGTIFQLDENGYKAWRDGADLNGTNGLLADGDNMLIATMGGGGLLLSTSWDGTLTEIARGMDNADGIAMLDDGSYLVSSWSGKIWHVIEDGSIMALVDTEAEGILQNDLTRSGNLIIVPNMGSDTVTAWRLEND
ncbi:MAG: hypothetical protein Hens3KO_21520 [Henriciella sp.]